MTDYADLTDEQVNAQIAERLFGYEKYSEVFGNYPYTQTYDASMGLVVPAMRERGYEFILVDDNGKTEIAFEKDPQITAPVVTSFNRTPRAICEAALLALDMEGDHWIRRNRDALP